MPVAIIAAMEEEIQPLKNRLENCRTEEIAGFSFHHGSLYGKEVVCLKSGIGKVNSAISTTVLLEQFKPELVINTGSAGGFDPSLEVGDLVVSERVLHHDVDIAAFGYKKGQVPGLPKTFDADASLIRTVTAQMDRINDISCKKGLIASGDRFIHEEKDVSALKTDFPDILACDMEAAAIAQACHLFHVPFVVIRAISDIPGKENVVAFQTFLEKATQIYTRFLLEMLKCM